MSLKKLVLMGSTLGIACTPIIANANLDVSNYTAQPSTVKIVTKGKKPQCSNGYPFTKLTLPIKNGIPGKSSTTPLEARTICGDRSASEPCVAEMYATSNCDASGAKPMARFKIDLKTLDITVLSVVEPYKVFVTGSIVKVCFKECK